VTDKTESATKLGFMGAWSMAVGGMIGGGIFSTLGVVVGIAGPWAWLSFAAAGLVALAAGYSYVKLAIYYDEGGGSLPYRKLVRRNGDLKTVVTHVNFDSKQRKGAKHERQPKTISCH
jgi:hypothetical protein